MSTLRQTGLEWLSFCAHDSEDSSLMTRLIFADQIGSKAHKELEHFGGLDEEIGERNSEFFELWTDKYVE